MRHFNRLLSSVAVLPVALTLLGLAFSQTEDRQPRKVAFLVGVEKYNHALDPALYAERDVRELARILQVEFDVTLLTGADATLENIEKRLNQVIEGKGKGGRLRQGDLILVSLNGHGLQMKVKPGDDREDAFFCPVDALPGKPATLFSLTRLVDEKLGPLGSRNLILVDACRNDPNPNRGTRGLEGRDMKLPRDTAVLFGCGRGEKSHGDGKAGGGHGLFTYAVLKGLRGESAPGGKVAWGDLVNHVQRMMDDDEEIKQLLKGSKQTPVLASGELPRTLLLELPKELKLDLGGGQELELVRIDPGEFEMGAADGEKDAWDFEKPRHRVQITRTFYLGKHHLTRGQFRAFVKAKGYQTEAEKGEGARAWEEPGKWTKRRDCTWKNPGFPQTDDHPVTCVSWNDALACCAWLGEQGRDQLRRKLGSGDWQVKLPTEAQWEYACRAGETTPYHFGTQLNGVQANCNGQTPYGTNDKGPYLKGTTAVGKYPANRWGLHDMHGNLWQWCEDYFDAGYYSTSPAVDPVNGNLAGPGYRVNRGGSWCGYARNCRAAFRRKDVASGRSNGVGFRVALRLD